MKKRMLSLFLCIAIIFSMLPGQALAEGEEPSTGETQPQVTEPAATEPAETEPEVSEPEVTEPEVTDPESAESEEESTDTTEETAPEDEPSAQSDLPGGTCGDNATWTFDEASGVLTISGSGDMYEFTSIGSNASGSDIHELPWSDWIPQILSVEIRQGITGIGSGAFSGASNLTAVSLPDGLERIESMVFFNAASLANISLPSTLTSLGYRCVSGCTALKSITLPEGLTYMNSEVFSGAGITRVAVPGSLTTLNSKVFATEYLEAVFLPSSIQYIPNNAFSGATRLTDIYYGGTEKEWDKVKPYSSSDYNSAIVHCNCTGLGTPGAPEEHPRGQIGTDVYWEFDPLTGILSITGTGTIEDFDFSPPWEDFAVRILEVHISEGITNLPIASFSNCTQMQKIVVPASLTWFDTSVFTTNHITTAGPIGSGCDYEFGWTEHIPAFAFEYLPITAIRIPQTLKSVSSSAFNGCGALTDIYYPGTPSQYNAIEKNTWHNSSFINANVHYGSFDKEIRFYSKYDADAMAACFAGGLPDCFVTEETDAAFAADPTALVGRYVLVEYTRDSDGIDSLTRMTALESAIDTVTTISSGGITIGDKVFPMDGGIEALEIYLGETVLYHTLNGELVDIEILQEKTGYLTYWYEDTSQLWIQSDKNAADSKLYDLGFTIPPEHIWFLNLGSDDNNQLNVPVNYVADSNRCIFEITPCVERRPDGFSAKKHGWPIINGNEPLGYDNSTPIILDFTTYFAAGINWKSFDAGLRNEFHNFTQEGVCFGYSLLAIAQYYNDTDLSKPHVNLRSYFSNSGSTLNEYGYDSIATAGSHSQYVLYHSDANGAKVPMSDVVALIEKAQRSQFCSEFYYGNRNTAKFIGEKDFEDLIAYLNGDKPEPLLAVVKYTNTTTGSISNHAVVVDTTFKPIYIGSGQYIIYVYNCNSPMLSNPLSNPKVEYTCPQSTLLIDTFKNEWYYGYAGDAKYGIGQTSQQDAYNICFHDVSEMSYSFFRDYYENPLEFDRERISLIFEYGKTNIPFTDDLPFLIAYRDNPETGERQKVFEIRDNAPAFYIDGCGYTAYAAGSGNRSSNLGMLTLPKGKYRIQVNTEANLQCMYRENIFTYGGSGDVELVIDYAEDSATVRTSVSPAKMSLAFAGADIRYSSIVGVNLEPYTSVTMSVQAADYSTSVSTNIPAESITLQHAVDGELIDITPDMIHQHTDLVHNGAVAATCTAAGHAEHYLCHCGVAFDGEDAYEEITDIEIPALGHSGQWTPTGNIEGEEFRVCERCGEEEIRMIGNLLVMDPETLGEHTSVWIDGLIYPVQTENGQAVIPLPEGDAFYMQTYTFHIGDERDVHTQYPTGMHVWKVEKNPEGIFTAERIEELDNLLQYSGASIRIVGVKGIRMITSITKGNKSALTGAGLAGYTLEEYGTALCWATDLAPGEDLVLGKEYTRSNYAYKKGVADPIFAQTAELIQYTNVLVGFSDDQCIPDIVMRPYIILCDADGNQVTLYGGSIHRSIGYIAYQNRNVFLSGNASYDYVWDIIHHVYGDQFDEDYKG